jgi:ribosomal protein S18 acetylase RimI-like enzyme
MSKSGFMPDIRPLVPDEWFILRDVRLTALAESPHAFLSTYERERVYGEDRWRAEFARGDWNVGFAEGRPASLLGVTREPNTPVDACYLEYLWVAPGWRGRHVALDMIAAVLEGLRARGMRTAFLWVLDGNEVAMRLYQRAGFMSTNHRQPLVARPGRTEERLYLNLDLSRGSAPDRRCHDRGKVAPTVVSPRSTVIAATRIAPVGGQEPTRVKWSRPPPGSGSGRSRTARGGAGRDGRPGRGGASPAG